VIALDRDTFVVFDLDDTLYNEDHYHCSGIKAVADFVRQVYGVEVLHKLVAWKAAGIKDLWSMLCNELRICTDAKEAFLWAYRLHAPTITMEPSTRDAVARISTACSGVAILTDGRSTTQRLKIAALKLDSYPLFVSEEWQSEKPHPARFIEIARKYPAKRYVYVGDNPQKDFKAPNELGWVTVGLRGNGSNIHPQYTEHLAPIYLHSLWIAHITNLCEFLC
jgi:putative hydrolase of the HAD superfamily